MIRRIRVWEVTCHACEEKAITFSAHPTLPQGWTEREETFSITGLTTVTTTEERHYCPRCSIEEGA